MSSNDDEYDLSSVRYPERVARAVVKQVNKYVEVMIGQSRVIEGNWEDKDSIFGAFAREELEFGRLLGSGGFSDVYQLRGLNLKPDSETMDLSHHQVATRKRIEKEIQAENGSQKYVVKHLRPHRMCNAVKFCTSASDLVVEAQFLSSLDHKNILKIRAWSIGGIKAYSDGRSDGYFLILDCLIDTLDHRIVLWAKERYSRAHSALTNKKALFLSELLDRAKIAHDIASALDYLHRKDMVFRDLKPNNVGFDKHGTAKIFDFGLSRELPDPTKNVNDVYHMSGKIGTVRYMAPECLLEKHYNQKVDTYSWAILFWQMLTLEKPYGGLNKDDHEAFVCRKGYRPKLNPKWPNSLKVLIKKSWAQKIEDRLTMMDVMTFMERIEEELASILQHHRSRVLQSLVPRTISFTRSSGGATCPLGSREKNILLA